jgi:ABC-type amino acid transport substrate-binding protein
MLLLGAAACGLPRDASGTLDQVRDGTMRVGVVQDAPWAFDSAGTVGGVEAALVMDVARGEHARVTWVRGAEGDLMKQLQQRQLDLVIGGLTSDLPWAKTLAFTRPYYTDTVTMHTADGPAPAPRMHVLAAAPGENAWLMRVERTLIERQGEIPAMLRRTHA